MSINQAFTSYGNPKGNAPLTSLWMNAHTARAKVTTAEAKNGRKCAAVHRRL